MSLGTEIALIKALGNGGGSGGGVLVVTEATATLNKTWQEIHDAFMLGGAVISWSETDCKQVVTISHDNRIGEYKVETKEITYITNSASGYPQRQF